MRRKFEMHNLGSTTTDHSVHAPVDPQVGRRVGPGVDPAVGPRVGVICRVKRAIAHRRGDRGDRVLPTYLRYPKVGAR